MGKNIEIKARCRDLKKIRKLLKQLPARLEGADRQTDTFFSVADGRLKLRESALYGALLIPYVRSNSKGPKASEYTLIQTPEVLKTKELFSRILGVRGIIEKKREIYIYKNVRIHLDQVKNLGAFIEFEAVVSPHDNESTSHSNIDYLMNYLQIAEKDCSPAPILIFWNKLKNRIDMFSKLERFLKDKFPASHVVDAPEDEERSLMTATAVLFLEMAYRDFEMSKEEIEEIRNTLSDFFQLKENEVDELLSFAEESRKARNDIWKFTNLLKQNLSHEQKLRILERLWELIYADQKVDKYEDALIRKITNLLGLEHAEMISAKLKARKKSE